MMRVFLLLMLLAGPTGTACLRFEDQVALIRDQCVAGDNPPPLPPGVTAKDWERTDDMINAFWADGDGYGDVETSKEFTYGEVTAKGARQLAAALLGTTTGSGGGSDQNG